MGVHSCRPTQIAPALGGLSEGPFDIDLYIFGISKKEPFPASLKLLPEKLLPSV